MAACQTPVFPGAAGIGDHFQMKKKNDSPIRKCGGVWGVSVQEAEENKTWKRKVSGTRGSLPGQAGLGTRGSLPWTQEKRQGARSKIAIAHARHIYTCLAAVDTVVAN